MSDKLKSGRAEGKIIPVGLHGGMSEEAVKEVYGVDKIKHPEHYTKYSVEVIEITRHLPFCLGNVVKYVLRAPYKGGVEDCDKALQYLEWCDAPVYMATNVYYNWRSDVLALWSELEADGSPVARVQAGFLDGLLEATETGEYQDMLRDYIEELRGLLEKA